MTYSLRPPTVPGSTPRPKPFGKPRSSPMRTVEPVFLPWVQEARSRRACSTIVPCHSSERGLVHLLERSPGSIRGPVIRSPAPNRLSCTHRR